MIWVSWRQHRSQAIACLGVLAALAIYAIVLGTSMRTAFSHDGLPACLIRATCRWYQQEGKAACHRCPQVVTYIAEPTNQMRLAAEGELSAAPTNSNSLSS